MFLSGLLCSRADLDAWKGHLSIQVINVIVAVDGLLLGIIFLGPIQNQTIIEAAY